MTRVRKAASPSFESRRGYDIASTNDVPGFTVSSLLFTGGDVEYQPPEGGVVAMSLNYPIDCHAGDNTKLAIDQSILLPGAPSPHILTAHPGVMMMLVGPFVV